MVKKYIILANTNNSEFDIPRHLTEINKEPLIKRTIRLLKENGIENIIISSHDTRFDDLGVKRYEPKFNNYFKGEGDWIDAFPIELLKEPVTFIFGDVYYSENAIKTIVENDTDSTLFFCTHNNNDKRYIKEYDEPLAYKVVDYKLFKDKIKEVKKLKQEGKCCREPIVWELYRVINNQDINEHIMTNNYIAINDESCDIDNKIDVIKLKNKIEKSKYKLSVIIPYYETYDLTVKLIQELTIQKTDEVEIILIDDYCKNEFNNLKEELTLNGIRLIRHTNNLGVAKSRNEGIEKSKGKYISFIDCDDMITMDYIDTLLNAIDKYDTDIINFNWYDMSQHLEIRRPDNFATWKAIYKKETMPVFMENREFGSEDVFFQSDIKDRINRNVYTIKYLDKLLYMYNSNREGSLFWKKTHKLDK